jgi:hypothetical protein
MGFFKWFYDLFPEPSKYEYISTVTIIGATDLNTIPGVTIAPFCKISLLQYSTEPETIIQTTSRKHGTNSPQWDEHFELYSIFQFISSLSPNIPIVRISVWTGHDSLGYVDIADFVEDLEIEKVYHLVWHGSSISFSQNRVCTGSLKVKFDCRFRVVPKEIMHVSCNQDGFSDLNHVAKSCIYDSPSLSRDFKEIVSDEIQCVEMPDQSQYLLDMPSPFANDSGSQKGSMSFWFRPSMDYLSKITDGDYQKCNFPLLRYKYNEYSDFNICAYNITIVSGISTEFTVDPKGFERVFALYRFGEWNNKVVTWDTECYHEYINGVLVEPSAKPSSIFDGKSSKFVLYPGFDGQIAEFSTWNGRMSAVQILNNYSAWIKNVKVETSPQIEVEPKKREVSMVETNVMITIE